MSGKVYHAAQETSQVFAFTAVNMERARVIIARYPAGKQQSALMPLLTLAQKQNRNWLSKAAMDVVAEMLGMPPVRVYEVASFYTMYNLEPVGEYVIEVCTTTPCWLRGSEKIVEACERRLGISVGDTTADGKFTLREAECLGACVNAPMCAVGGNYYEDLTPQNVVKIIDVLSGGQQPKAGPQNTRRSSEPEGGATTLKEMK